VLSETVQSIYKVSRVRCDEICASREGKAKLPVGSVRPLFSGWLVRPRLNPRLTLIPHLREHYFEIIRYRPLLLRRLFDQATFEVCRNTKI